MRSLLLTLGCMTIVVMIFNCSSRSDKIDETMNVRNAVVDTTRSPLISAYEACLISIELARVAEQSQETAIQDLGNTILAENSIILSEIKSMADSRDIALPDSIGKRNYYEPAVLKKKQGAEFEKALTRAMPRELKLFSLYLRDLKNDKNPETREFATRQLPVIRKQVNTARTILKEYNEASKKKSEQTS
jgi:putative membrane protein